MERLTDSKRNSDGTASSKESLIDIEHDRPSAYCGEILTKLADYEDLEEQGRLLALPCKIGDRLYWIDDEDDDGNKGLCIKQYNEDEKVQAIGIDKDGDIFVMLGIDEFFTAPDTIGSQYALLTLEDANKMLAEMKKNESEE
jgi:hypothetical protein